MVTCSTNTIRTILASTTRMWSVPWRLSSRLKTPNGTMPFKLLEVKTWVFNNFTLERAMHLFMLFFILRWLEIILLPLDVLFCVYVNSELALSAIHKLPPSQGYNFLMIQCSKFPQCCNRLCFSSCTIKDTALSLRNYYLPIYFF